MHRLGRVLGVLALLGTAFVAQGTVAAPAALADSGSGGGSSINCTQPTAMLLCAAVQYGGTYQSAPRDPNGPGGSGGDSGGYISSCWLQPQTAWGSPDTDASSPEGLQQYFADMAQAWDHDPGFHPWYNGVDLIYDQGKGGDKDAIGLTKPPYNIGVSGGRWYTIACDLDTYKYSDYVAIQTAMGVTGDNLNYEAWFWIKSPKDIPSGVPQITPAMLAGFAANHVRIDADFPRLSPAVTATQTVNLPVETLDSAADGYHTYSTSASLAGITSWVTASPVSVTYTANPQDFISPESVTCDFNANGSIKGTCPAFGFTEPASAGEQETITATTTWQVQWAGSTDYGETGWTEQLPGPNPAFTRTVTVQEVQAVNH